MLFDSIYLAGPFFNPKQLELIEKIETLIENCFQSREYSLYSPRKDCVLKNLSKEDKIKNAKRVYVDNISQIMGCTLMIAVIDDHDAGTMFEIGYLTSIKDGADILSANYPFLITVSGSGYGLNVMLQESVDCHVSDLNKLESVLKSLVKYRNDDLMPEDIVKNLNNLSVLNKEEVY